MTHRLLDISRLISRVGLGPPSGIDRVEHAYFREFLRREGRVHFLCRLPRSYAVLDRQAGQVLFNKINGVEPWGSRGIAGFILPRMTALQQRVVADVWRLAGTKCSSRDLSRCFPRIFSEGLQYFNIGHSNLRPVVFEALEKVAGSKITVFVHDIIPITHPEFSRPEVCARFTADMLRVGRLADRVIYNSQATRDAAEAWFAQVGPVPEGLVAHLGTEDAPPPVFRAESARPQFITIGTIEPRKNHAMLLRIWQRLHRALPAGEVPLLHVAGRRGWKNREVFHMLDNDPMMGVSVFEHNDLSDDALQALLAESRALLFPSHVEGFGLPLVEAARLGVPVICGENAIYQEILGDYPLYLPVDNPYAWEKEILERAGRLRESEAERQVRGRSVALPDWNGHFDRIFRFV